MSLIINTLLLCTILSDININFIAETERKRKVKEAHLQAPIPDKSSSTSSNVILTERRADVQLVTSQIQEDSRNSDLTGFGDITDFFDRVEFQNRGAAYTATAAIGPSTPSK
ncbi:hypothetical protein GLOIN_2v1771489 [Rhizophagus irregularis DAOM 181602=DAOM 197198]|uniref:Uncharacterized protein n=1 Tax=Rhizophagus irregularis (strain DAOM 181602 / DAOM 197198 / MUCL 43194) TaxID=747089 RepID=A0A2P4Q9I2_RHIID|nr:hypothetical protein GLOIN_2v1771489 [Rhizophagus irregularis DAOM 181602=DAOM 197198]POG74277.1 hypothetical protein GLOIN_2v1771489 [Rhizophagus irregularis DAOM 181602=DAOM 197198]|eukprot:XP_025181143.1 hypothetical protein GLOIN_2v1771489 [Rhizophagus irregularis DAOM 181602=DAOM 197198]